MKITSLVTTLVLGLSSVAFAAPTERSFRAPTVRDHRPGMPQHVRWTALGESRVRNGRQVIDVASQVRFSKLKIEATRGVTRLDAVLITFANGRTQRFELDARIGMNTAPAMITLDRRDRQISKIVILTKGSSRSSFAVLGA